MPSSTREEESPTDSLDDYNRLAGSIERIDTPLRSKRTSHGFSRTDSPSTKTLQLAMGLWPRTPLRDATWNNITAHARTTVIYNLEKAVSVLGRAHGHWIALNICQHHAKVVNEAVKVSLETTTAASSQDDDVSHEHDVAHGVSSARVDNENTRCETPASVLSEDDDIDEAASRVLQPTLSQHNVSLLCGADIG
ncbi:hypothetical protein BCR37DRAFT_375786 [Protomyces lactucae-debilis]|uniref:Uncharacterized protein n=1 Tax=Protomyces lactucae-debilis TaxID=2754530 RepID=A0A1Y2FV41_PROLT|nr:uncharacterized protein BCR37DRAFT_375786 [Protomyces lactucae-debilis]ORY87862.1 hypothetical protein BCR37DRAFT_375786 [Protomyces lactucae-debilis]